MDVTALLLSRIQFGFTISFRIIFAFTIGLAAWLYVDLLKAISRAMLLDSRLERLRNEWVRAVLLDRQAAIRQSHGIFAIIASQRTAFSNFRALLI
jgi:cytochrome bd-type quinol oxidase subunit 1